ncbi:MAG: alpha/beta hydrolase [Burkholderiales bacterium]
MTAADFAVVDSLLDPYPIARVATARGGMSYRHAGTGPTSLVYLHGIGSQSGSWVQQFEGLTGDFRAIAWDAPGYGDSDPIETESPAASEYAARLGSFLAELGIGRPVIVASSLGALIATSYAATRPEGVAGLVLLNPAGGYGLAEPSTREEKLAARLARLARLGPRGMAENLPAGMLSEGASKTARGIASWSQARIDPHGYAQAARMLAHGTLVKDAARYDGPVLVVAASADTITPAQDCESIARAFPHATFQLLDGPGHLSYVEAPEIVNALIAKFATTCTKGGEA